MSDQYGLESNFKFAASSNSFSQMDRVIELLEGIEKATKETAQTIASTSLGKDLMKSLNADGVKREGKEIQGAVKQIGNALSPLKSEFRALRAESRNIDFGEMTDTAQFKQASNEISAYIRKLKELENQISGSTPADREFKASLQSQQRMAGDKVKVAKANRDASVAAERISFSEAVKGAGQRVVDTFSEPLEAAAELQQSLAGVKKLADDLSASGAQTLQNQVFNLSARLGIEDTKVASIFEDLAGSGKKFGDEMGGIGSRIAEVEQILKNQQALDISAGAATQLDVTLGSIYKNLVSKDPNAIVELNARVASSVNELADKLSDVRISAEDVIPVMNVVMNTVGDAKNFPVDQIAAYSAAIASLGTIEPEAAGSFFNRLSAKMSENTAAFASALNMTSREFEEKLNTDKLGVVTDLAAAYKNVQGGELAQGSFFSSIGIGSVQDQKLLQGLANNIDVLQSASKVAKAGFEGREVNESIDATGKKVITLGERLKQLSIDKEVGNKLQTSAFQTQRFDSSLKALSDTLGSAVIDVITPFKSLASDIILVFLQLTQAAPGLTKALSALVFGMGALAVAAGGVGASLFAFQQAQAIATTAAITMQSSLIPLTGFFQTSMNAFKGTFPWTNAFHQSTVMAEEFTVAATGAKGMVAGELRTAFIGLRAQVLLTSQAALSMGRAFLLSPLGMAIGSFLLLDRLLQQANPQVRLLGTLFSVFSSAAGFAFGILEGFVGAFLKLLKVPAGAAGGLLASPFTAIAQALEFAMESFRNWERSGKHIGESIFNILANPFIFAASATAGAWDRTINFIAGLLKPLADLAAYIGHFIQGSLSEASPGPSFMTRANWLKTAGSVAGSMGLMSIAAVFTGDKIQQAMIAATGWTLHVWLKASEKINSIFASFSLPEALTNFAVEIGNAWNNTFGMMTSGWTNFVSTFTSTTPDFGGLAFAGAAAMKPLLAWGLPDIVSENFDKITQPRSPASTPQVTPPATPPQLEPVAQISGQVQETQTIWQQMWSRIGDLTQQGVERVRGAIETNLGAGALAFVDKLGAIVSTFVQRYIVIADAFKGQGGNNLFAPFVGGALIVWETVKAFGALSREFMHFEEGFLHKVIDNFNLLGFTALMLSSMLMNLVQVPFEALKSLPFFIGQIVTGVTALFGLGNQKLLEEGASKYVGFLKVFDRPGIGTALAKGLPGIVAVLMGMNVFEDLTQQWTATLVGWSNTLPQIVEGAVAGLESVFNLVEPLLRSVYPEGINIFPAEEVRGQIYATLGEVGAIFATFWQNIAASAGKVGDAIKPIFEAIATFKIGTGLQLFANYMGFGDAMRPVTDFINSLPLLGMPIAELTVIEAAIGAIFDLLKSPTLSGFVGFLTGPLFKAVLAVGIIFSQVTQTIATAILGLPFQMLIVAMERAVAAAQVATGVVEAGGNAVKGSLIAPIQNFIVAQIKLIPGLISSAVSQLVRLVSQIPIVGTFLASVLQGVVNGMTHLFGLAREALPGYLKAVRTELNILGLKLMLLTPVFEALGASLVSGARYIINEALIPIGEAIGFLNPFKLMTLYAQTKGLQGVTKGVNPIDLAVTGIDDALIAVATRLGAFGKLQGEALKTAQNATRPLSNLLAGSVTETAKHIAEQAKNVSGAVASGTGEAIDRAFPIRVLSAKLIAVRKTYLGTKAALAYDKAYVMGFDLGPVIENFVLLRAILVPSLQILARAAFSWMTYYTVLEAFTPKLLNTVDAFARAHPELGIFSKLILGTTFVLRVLRFAVVDTTNAVIGFSKTFFQSFQVLAPIAGKTAGIIAYGIGLIIKGATLGVQSLGVVLLLPVVAISKVMQGMLIAVKYFTQQVKAEWLSFQQVFVDLGSAIAKGDVVGGLWAIARLVPYIIQVVVGIGFFNLKRAVTTGLIALAGVIRRITIDGISLLISKIIPYVVKKGYAIGVALVQGIIWGVQSGYKALVAATLTIFNILDQSLITIGRNVSRGLGIALTTINQMRMFGAGVVTVFGGLIGVLVVINKYLKFISIALRGIMWLLSALNLPFLVGLATAGFLIWQMQDGFKELNAMIDALNHPVKWLQDSMANIAKTFSGGINTDWIAFFVEKLIRVIPIVLGGIFLLGFAVKKHIFGGFMLVWDVVKGIANSLINVVRSVKAIPGAVMGIGTEGRILEGVHKTRSTLGLYKDPQSKEARENEFKLAKESAMFKQKVIANSQAEIYTLAQQQKTDYGHLAKEVEVTKGGFFGVGARKQKEWQLTGAGEEFHQKRLAETLEHKVGVFDNKSLKDVAKGISPARLGMMQGDELRTIFTKDRPDLAALGRALETIKTQNVAVMNVARMNGGNSNTTGNPSVEKIRYSRAELEQLSIRGLEGGRNSFNSTDLTPAQITKALKNLNVSADQFPDNSGTQNAERYPITQNTKKFIERLLQYQLAAATGKIDNKAAQGVASAAHLQNQFKLDTVDRSKIGDPVQFEELMRDKVAVLQAAIRNGSHAALKDFNFDDVASQLKDATSEEDYQLRLKGAIQNMMGHQLKTVENTFNQTPTIFETEASKLRSIAGQAPDKISHGLKGILSDVMGGIGQAFANAAKKLPGRRDGLSNEALRAIDRQIAGVAPLPNQRDQDSRRSKLEAAQRQLREGQLTSEKQAQVLQNIANLIQRDVYELTHPTMNPEQLRARVDRAKTERERLFNGMRGGNKALEQWITQFTAEEQRAISQQIKEGRFRGGALTTRGEDRTITEGTQRKTVHTYINNEASLARALGYENIKQVEQAFSTDEVLKNAKRSWGEQLRYLVGINEDTNAYNKQIDALRTQIDQRVERQTSGFAEREARRNAAMANREAGFLAQLNQVGRSRADFTARLNATQQKAFDDFLKTGKLQSTRPDEQFKGMAKQLGFGDDDVSVQAFKDFQAALGKSENKNIAEYFKNALQNDPEKLRGTGSPFVAVDGTQIDNPNERIKALIREAVPPERRAAAWDQLERMSANRRRSSQNPDALQAWEHALDYLATGRDATDLTVDQIAEIGRAMELQGSNESVAMQLRSIANQRNTGFGGITDSIKSFLKNIETDAESVEEYIHNRLTDMSSFSAFGIHPFATLSDVLRNVLFEPITSLVKGTWKWLGNAIGNIGTNAAALKARATRLLTSLPGVRTFAQARQRRETDLQNSLQSLSAKMGYENQEKFAEKFKEALAARGITEGRLQNKALQAILNSKRSKGVAETLNTSRFQEIQDSSSKIGEALAVTLGLNGRPEEIAKLLAPGGFTTRAVGPLRNYFLKSVVPAIVDVGLAPLKLIYKIVRNPGLSLTAIKTKTGQIADAVADFMVSSYTTIRRTFSYAATQLGKVPLFGKIWGAVSGFFGKIASRIQNMAAPATTQRLREEQARRNVPESNLYRARSGTFPVESLPDAPHAEIQRLNNTIATLSQFRAQEVSRLNPFKRLLIFATTAARGAKDAWAQAAEEISAGGWRGLIARFKRVGYLLKRNISEGSPGPSADTRANWEHTQQSVGQNMGEMAQSAHVAGQQIQGDMQRTARRSAGFLSALGGAVAGAGKAGMAVGGAITAIGFAAQTASYSLVNMGLLDEASAAKLNKFLEIFTLVGAVGGLMAPVMGAIVSSVAAIGSAFALIFNPVTLTMAAITGGILLANEGLKRFAGIDLLGPLFANVQEPIVGTIAFIQGKIDEVFVWMMDKFGTQLSPILEPMGAAVTTIQGAWQGFVDWFVAMPLVQTAIDIGMGLINALNHNPTVQIPLAWEGAIENIKGMLFNLPFVGDLIASLMKDSLDPTKILGNLFQGFHNMLDQLEHSGLARFGGGKMLDGLRGFLGGFGKKKAEVATEIPIEAGVKLNYKESLEAAIRQADFDARSGSATAQAASANLQYQMKTTGGQMDANQLGAAYQGAGGEFLQKAISKENNRLFLDQGAAAKEKRAAIEQELQTINQKEVELQANYVQAIEKVQVAAAAPAPTDFIQKLLGGGDQVAKFTAQAEAVSRTMVALKEQKVAIEKQIATNSVVFDVGTNRMLKNMGIDPDGLIVAVAEAKSAISTGIKEVGYAVSDRWRYLERSNGGNLSAMMTTDLQKAGGAFRILKGDVADFAKRAATSLGQMDWSGFKDAAGDFWTNIQFGLGQITSGFAGAGLSAVLFYVHLSPLAFVLGGIALAGLAITTNFLGLRSILVGLIRVFTGFAQIAVSSVMMIINVVRGLVKIFGGIPDALRGDFTRLGEGIEIVWTGIKDGARGLLRGLASVFGGGAEVLSGVFKGIGQSISIVFGPALINSAREAVSAIRQLFESAGETIANSLKKPGQVLENIANRFRKGKEQVADSAIGRTVGAIADVASGKAPNLDAARVAHDFDMRMRGKDPDAELTAGDRARLAQSQMENVLSTGFDTSRHLGADVIRPTNNQNVLSDIDDELRRAEAGLGSMRDRSVSAAGAANDALSSLGVALSSFAPALAAPLFMVGDLLSGFTGMSLALPQLSAMFPGVSAAIGGFTTALSAGSLTATGVIAGLGTVFTGTMAAISSAASITWVAISGPMLPLFVLIGGLVAAFVLFKTNFLGFGDIVSGVLTGIQDVVGGIWQVITDGIRDIGSMIGRIGGYLIKPLEPLLQLFGISPGNLAGQLQTAFVANAIAAILRPIRAIGFTIKTTLQIVFAVIKAVLWLGGLIVRIILTPITLVTNAVAGIVRGFQALGSILGSVITAPFQFLQGVVSWIWDRLMQLPALLGQAIANVPLIGPLLQNLGNSIFQGGAQTPVQQFASGGAVVGPGSGTADRIPALLSNGEFVVSAKPAQENMGLLTALNEGRSVEVMPMPAPTRIPLAIASKGETTQADAVPKQMPPVEININLQGDIVLAGTNSAADAQEFLTKIEPYLQQAVWGMFRNWVDFNR